jgi:polyisoprenoid-binding protein YceI
LFTGFILGEVQLNESAVTSNHTPAVVAKPDTAKVSTVEVKRDSVIKAPVSKTFTTKTANIKFFTKSPVEDIDAVNNQVTATLDNGTGDINFVALIKGFRFDNELMQEHFNGKEFLQSDVYPRAEFEGVITNLKAVNFSVDGKYSVKTEGTLKLHGVSKKLTTNGTITINHGKVSSQSVFTISFSDFNIKSFDDDAKDVEITVNAKYN